MGTGTSRPVGQPAWATQLIRVAVPSLRERSPGQEAASGGPSALGERGGRCKVIFCRSLVAAVEVCEAAPHLSAAPADAE